MKFKKYFYLFLLPFFITNAQSVDISVEDDVLVQEITEEEITSINFDEIEIFDENEFELPDIYISDVRTEFEEYLPGDIVQGQFVINNTTDNQISDLYYTVDRDRREGPITLEGESKENIFFSYRLPKDGNNEQVANIRLQQEDETLIINEEFSIKYSSQDIDNSYISITFAVILLVIVFLMIIFRKKSSVSYPIAMILLASSFIVPESVEAVHEDLCPNITGEYLTVPDGYEIDSSGDCVHPEDKCSNMIGVQYSIPTDFTIDSNGDCVESALDVCKNLRGVQYFVPWFYERDNWGNCNQQYEDQCLNIPDFQRHVPTGQFQDDDKNCFDTVAFDRCNNIPGIQESIPSGYQGYAYDWEYNGTVYPRESCYFIPSPNDLCSTIYGVQTEIPLGYRDSSNIRSPENIYKCQMVDWCPNRIGMQTYVPHQDRLDADGICRLNDVCVNIEGIQFPGPPEGFYDDESFRCYRYDKCTNIEGEQLSVPYGYEASPDGVCTNLDICPNIENIQRTVPEGYVVDGGVCVEEKTCDDQYCVSGDQYEWQKFPTGNTGDNMCIAGQEYTHTCTSSGWSPVPTGNTCTECNENSTEGELSCLGGQEYTCNNTESGWRTTQTGNTCTQCNDTQTEGDIVCINGQESTYTCTNSGWERNPTGNACSGCDNTHSQWDTTCIQGQENTYTCVGNDWTRNPTGNACSGCDDTHTEGGVSCVNGQESTYTCVGYDWEETPTGNACNSCPLIPGNVTSSTFNLFDIGGNFVLTDPVETDDESAIDLFNTYYRSDLVSEIDSYNQNNGSQADISLIYNGENPTIQSSQEPRYPQAIQGQANSSCSVSLCPLNPEDSIYANNPACSLFKEGENIISNGCYNPGGQTSIKLLTGPNFIDPGQYCSISWCAQGAEAQNCRVYIDGQEVGSGISGTIERRIGNTSEGVQVICNDGSGGLTTKKTADCRLSPDWNQF